MTMLRKTNRSAIAYAVPLALVLALGACGDDDDDMGPAPTPTPTMSPTPTPTNSPTPTSYDVSQCLQQEVAPGTTVADLVVPDVVTMSFASASNFPNGRDLDDPVIDITLAVLFLDIDADGQSPATFAQLPLNPPSNDVAFRSGFPYLAAPQGNPPLAQVSSGPFTFRTDAPGAYVRVDRMGMPAVSTALIPSDRKIAYNDANPAIDATGEFVPDLASKLEELTNGIGDDLLAAGFNICAD